MAARTDCYQRKPINPGIGLILIALAIILVAAAIGNAVDVLNGDHAIAKHVTDATAIHKCLDDNGPLEVWKSRSWQKPHRYFQVCRLPDGRLGFRIIELVRDGWHEVTSFVVREGTRTQLVEYLSAKAVRFAGKLSQVR